MAASKKKKVLLTLAIVLVVAVIIGGGTFATFTAQTKNASNSFSSGTIVLSDTVGAGSACLSTGAGTSVDAANTNSGCDVILSPTVQKPGQVATSGSVAIKNAGSLNGTLSFDVSACASANEATETYHGTGNICPQLTLEYKRGAGAWTPVALDGTGTGVDSHALASLATDTYTFRVTLAAGAPNTVQGLKGTFDVTWNLANA